MKLGAEAWLMLLAAALYLYDSLQLLASNEAVLVRSGRGRWHARFGAHRWKLGGKEPHLPNPFTPQRAMFRLSWPFEGEAPPAPALQVPAEIDVFGPFVCASLFCIFVMLPIGLFLPAGTAFIASVVAVLYLNNLIALGLMLRLRGPLNLSSRQWAGMAFECIVCPPFSINLVRRLCARIAVVETFTSAAPRLLSAHELAAAHAQCVLRLDEQLAYAPEGSARTQALQVTRSRFAMDEETP